VGGVSLSDQLSAVPPLQGIVDQVIIGVYEAFSVAIADTFWLSLIVTVVALALATFGLRDVPLQAPADRRLGTYGPCPAGVICRRSAARRPSPSGGPASGMIRTC
jgi:hypothetical protein